MTPEQKQKAREKRARDREAAFKERTARSYCAFKDCYNLVTERARIKAVKLAQTDKLRYCARPFESLLSHGIRVRMATQIFNHTEWLPEDCGRWLKMLGLWREDAQWILEEVSKKRARAIRAGGGIAIAHVDRKRGQREWEDQ